MFILSLWYLFSNRVISKREEKKWRSALFELRVGEMSERVADERGDGVLTICCGPS